jgi:hypothetical protein
MRWTAILLAGCLAASVGCRLTRSAVHNILNEPLEYLDEKKVTRQLREEAEDILKEMCLHRGRVFSHDFKQGFVDGYADYLEWGGASVPPAVPPLKYRRGRFLNPDGHARINDYFTGFQTGADMAASSGKRQFLTVPMLLPDTVPTPPVNAQQVPSEQCRTTGGTGNLSCAPGAGSAPPSGTSSSTPATGLPSPNRPMANPETNPMKPKIPSAPSPKDPPQSDGKDSDLSLPSIPKVGEDGSKPSPSTGQTSADVSEPLEKQLRVFEMTSDSVPPIQRIVVPPLRDIPQKPGR